jgi:ribosomal protein L10
MINNYINKFKLEQIKQIEKNYNYIYFFRYNDIDYNEKNNLKKEIKKLNFNFFILKQSLIKYFFTHLKSQGSLIIIYGNNPLNINTIVQKIKKIEFIYLFNKNLIFSNIKIKKIVNKNIILNYQIKKPLFYFYKLLKKIKQANIT